MEKNDGGQMMYEVECVYQMAAKMRCVVEEYHFDYRRKGRIKVTVELSRLEGTPELPFNELDATK